MKKLLLTLSLLLLLGLAACGNNASKETANLQTTQEATADTSAAVEKETPQPAEPAAPADSASTEDQSQDADANADGENEEDGTAEPEEVKDEYLNIAIFGLDVNTNLTKDSEGRWKQLRSGFRSDTIMIASINKGTGDVKLVSVYRDTFLNTDSDNYHKANAAYSMGGPQRAIDMLNRNMDLDIEKYIAISYHSMMDLVDGLGGITVDVEKAALNEINGYQTTIVNDLALPGYTPVTEAGEQVLNGLQVCAYCRLRHDFPRGDLDRAAHQRKVLKSIEAKVKQTDLKTVVAIFNKVVGEIDTNFDTLELLELVNDVNNYHIAGEGGFPEDSMVTMGMLGKEGSCVIPINLKNNVIWLHQFLFENEEYAPSETVESLNATIEAKIAPYIGAQ